MFEALWIKRTIFSILLCSFVFVIPSLTIAQTETVVTGGLAADRRAELEQELAEIEKEIARQQEILQSKQRETVSIERDVAILNAQIEAAALSIRAKNIAVEKLGKGISDKTKTIGELDERISRGKQSLSQLIRKTNELDSYSIAEVVLSSRELSDFFSDMDTFISIKSALASLFAEIRENKDIVETEREKLDRERKAEIDARVVVEEKKRLVQKSEAQKKSLLSLSRQQEKEYKALLTEREKRAVEIRAALFSLRDSAAIPFGTALQYATEASKLTGVRPAFLLAILTQESNLGQNVGQCYLKNSATGDGVGKNTGTPFKGVMKVGRDVEPFIELSKRLGFDPFNQVVSCPQAAGYGGAMGPSQFIASTWVMYESRVASALGVSVPNPWAPRDAFFASSLFLDDLGAGKGGYSAEFEAAARYYAGAGWSTRGRGYATSVLKHASNIQENMIDPLEAF